MMDSAESCVPPGFRFHPTDEELVGYYLRKKVASQKIDLDVIRDIDLYRIEPWDLQDKCRIGYEEQNEWYFFSHKDKKYPTGTRTNRATIAGFWKATGRDKSVYERAKLIGMRKTLVFYKGRAPNGQKTDWIMHEYRLESDENGPPQEEGWVVCRAFKKKATGQTKSSNNINIINETWDSSYFYEDQSNSVDPLDFITRQQQHHHQLTYLSQNNSFICKREIEQAETLNRLLNSSSANNSDPIFVHDLPQLESPSLPLPKRPITATTTSEKNKMVGEDLHGLGQKVTDWRDLDKFVASQLSHDHQGEADVSTSTAGFEAHEQDDDSDLGYLKLSGFLSSSSDCDIGICVFDK